MGGVTGETVEAMPGCGCKDGRASQRAPPLVVQAPKVGAPAVVCKALTDRTHHPIGWTRPERSEARASLPVTAHLLHA